MNKIESSKMRQLEKLEKRVIYPDVEFYGTYIHDGRDIYLCNDTEERDKDKITVECYIKNNILTTNLKREYISRFGKKVTEKATQTVELREGELLVYIPELGFTIPEYKMITIPEAIDLYKIINGEDISEKGE